MPIRESAPLGAPVWIELTSSDTARAKDFYGQLFGWSFFDAGEEYGGYINALKDDAQIAGIMANDPQWGIPDGWGTYLAVADARASYATALEAGATSLSEPMDVMDLGVMAFVADPSGAAIGLWQSREMGGYAIGDEDGTPAWHELITRDFAKTVEFYRTVFGWETQVTGDSDEFRYTVQVVDGVQKAGIMDGSGFLPEGVAPSWSVYFGTSDVDATATKTVELGGTIVDGPDDTPYGKLATLADPTGAVFKLRSLPA